MEERGKEMRAKRHLVYTSVFFFLVFLLLLMLVLKNGYCFSDKAVNQGIAGIRTPFLTALMVFVSAMSDWKVLCVLSLILVLSYIYKRNKEKTIFIVLAMLGGVLLRFGISNIIQRARPENVIVDVSGYSFPSGHATMSAIFFIMLFFLFKHRVGSICKRNWLILASVLAFLLVGFSRIYLSAHWLSDVLAGFCLGLFWVIFCYLIVERVFKKN